MDNLAREYKDFIIDAFVEESLRKIKKIEKGLKVVANILDEILEDSEDEQLDETWTNKCVSSGTLKIEDIFNAIENFLPISLSLDFYLTKNEEEKYVVFEKILDYMNDIAPGGCCFGPLREDGACFGFWRE